MEKENALLISSRALSKKNVSVCPTHAVELIHRHLQFDPEIPKVYSIKIKVCIDNTTLQ